MQHLIQENRQLKQALNQKAQNQSTGSESHDVSKDEQIKRLQEELDLLKNT